MIHDALLISGPCNRKLERISEDDESHGIGIAWTGRKNIDRWFRCADATAAKEHPLSFAFTPAEQPFLELLLGFKFTGGGNVSVAGETGPAVVDRGDGCLLAGRVAFPPLRPTPPALLWPHAPWKRPRLGRAAGERAYRTGGRTAKFCGHALRLPN